MANDDRQSQQFIREVDEELRRAQLKAIWDRFAPLIIGACVLVVAITAGYRGWIWWEERQAAEAGDRYIAAIRALEGEGADAESELAQIAASGGGGYAALAQLRLAGHKAAGDKAAALAQFDTIAGYSDVAEPLRALARIRAALLALDTGDLAGARSRAEPLNVAGGAWRHAAREVLGTAAYESGELEAARDFFTAIQEDAETPSDIWMRSSMMVSLIDGQLAAPDAAPARLVPGAPAPAPAAPTGGSQSAVPAASVTGSVAAPAAQAPAATDQPEAAATAPAQPVAPIPPQ